jgi:UDP-glucose 4-epimerase
VEERIRMSILITGGAGYIGSHVLKELLDMSFDAVVIDNLQKGHRESLLGGMFVFGDLADTDLLDEVFSTNNIEAVMHFAADSLVGESMMNPAKYYSNNVVNGLNLLEAMRKHGVDKIVFSSTAAVYGDPSETPITEDCPRNPTSVYGHSKLMFEDILKNYERAYGICSVSLRYFNAAGADLSGVIGEKHNPETHLIPIVLQVALGLRDHVDIYGTNYDTPDGTCIRDYIHVTDLAKAHILALTALKDGIKSCVYNLGNEKGFSVKEVIEMCHKVTKKDIPAVNAERRPGDPAILVASSKRIHEDLRWEPRYGDLETIVESAWKWHSR